MAAADRIEQFSKLPTQHKVLAFAFLGVFMGVIFYFMFYSGLQEEKATLDQKIGELKDKRDVLEEKKRKYLSFRNKVNRMLEEQKELMKVLPRESEIHTLLRSVHAQAELAGLNILLFEQRPEVREKYYARIPVKLQIRGTYHQINKFFNAVGHLKRIVNIHNLTLQKPVQTDQGVELEASFQASTFRFLESGNKGKKKGRGKKG